MKAFRGKNQQASWIGWWYVTCSPCRSPCGLLVVARKPAAPLIALGLQMFFKKNGMARFVDRQHLFLRVSLAVICFVCVFVQDEQTKFTEVLYMFTVSRVFPFPSRPCPLRCSVMSVCAMSRCTISIPFHYYGRAPKWAPQIMCVPNRCTCLCVLVCV